MNREPLKLQSLHAQTRPFPDDAPLDCGIIVYQCSPARLNIQVRTLGPINERGTGKPKRMMSNATVNREQAEALRDELTAWLNEFRS